MKLTENRGGIKTSSASEKQSRVRKQQGRIREAEREEAMRMDTVGTGKAIIINNLSNVFVFAAAGRITGKTINHPPSRSPAFTDRTQHAKSNITKRGMSWLKTYQGSMCPGLDSWQWWRCV